MKPSGFLKNALASAAVAAALAVPALGAEDGTGPHPPGATMEEGENIVTAANQYYAPGTYLAPSSTDPVDVKLVLVIDVSSSMTDEEYGIQIDVIVNALLSDHVQAAWFGPEPGRQTGALESIALCVVAFGSKANLEIPWVDFRADDPNLKTRIRAFAAQVEALKENRNKKVGTGTELDVMLKYIRQNVIEAGWEAKVRTIIDVISDGKDTWLPIVAERARLAEMDVTINALAIVNDVATLDEDYRENLVTQWSDIPEDSSIIPGRVWAIARKMKAEGNSSEALREFRLEGVKAFHQKIVWETVMLELDTSTLFPENEQLPEAPRSPVMGMQP